MPEIISEIGDMEYKHLISSVHRVVSLSKSSIKIHNFNTSTLKRCKVGRAASTSLVKAVDT